MARARIRRYRSSWMSSGEWLIVGIALLMGIIQIFSRIRFIAFTKSNIPALSSLETHQQIAYDAIEL